MPQGYFRFMITVQNTGTVPFDAYVGLDVYDGASKYAGFWGKKIQIAPGASSTVYLASQSKSWVTGAHNYFVGLYSKANSEPAPYSTYESWTIFEPIPEYPNYVDAASLVASKTGSVSI